MLTFGRENALVEPRVRLQSDREKRATIAVIGPDVLDPGKRSTKRHAQSRGKSQKKMNANSVMAREFHS